MQTRQLDSFESVLLSYAEMCYSVAFALTRNPQRAEDLAKHALTQVWHLRNGVGGRNAVKKALLSALRERFLQYYCHVPRAFRNEARIGKDPLCIAPNVERNIERVSRSVRIAT